MNVLTAIANNLRQARPLAYLVVIGIAAIAASGCATEKSIVSVDETSSEAPTTSMVTTDYTMVVIKDPRSERRRRGVNIYRSGSVFAYGDDPLLARVAKRIASDHKVEVVEHWPLKNLDVLCFTIKRPSDDTLASLNDDKRVLWVQPFNQFSLQLADETGGYMDAVPLHTLAGKHLDFSHIDTFFRGLDTRGASTKIAVIDTAVDTSHPNLSRQSISKRNFAGSRGSSKKEAHGTAVIGLLGSRALKEGDPIGLANDADLYSLRGCWQNAQGKGTCNTLTLALALDAVVDINPDILNLSLTGPRDPVLDALIQKIVANNTLIVAAHDETRPTNKRFPRAQAGVIYVYGVDEEVETLPEQDNLLYAPKHALSLTPDAGYKLVSGHSIATPHVSALAACIKDSNPSISRDELIMQLQGWMGRLAHQSGPKYSVKSF